MNPRLAGLLEYLSDSLDATRQAETDALYRGALDWEPVPRPPVVVTCPLPDDAPFRPYPHREIFDDAEKMLFNELVYAFETSIALHGKIGSDLPITIRANFGTVLIASMFGATVRQTDDNPPWIVPQEGAGVSLEQIADTDPRDVLRGRIPRAAEAMQTFHDLLDGYPTLKSMVRIVVPDLQGPFDNAELLRGREIFLDLATAPEAIERAMDTLATAQIHLARYFEQWTTEPRDGYCHQHAVMLKGNILIRDDSAIMVSPAMYRRQITPHNERVLRELGGGGIHCCGVVSHLVDEWLQLPSIRSLDLGQPELNDLDAIYAKAQAKHVAVTRLAVSETDLRTGRARERFPTGAVLIHRAGDLEAAVRSVRSRPADRRRLRRCREQPRQQHE